ncbi:MAG: hypothetical protein M1826_004263 [Phylliscum demangeonii]|nr:MAG: hypothetical protein M1826_004263 [Phylliscum demangeonii]
MSTRPRIRNHDIRHEFERIKTLDAGHGKGPGALNGGIYVVRRKYDQLKLVEKVIPSKEIAYSTLTQELVMLRAVEHPNITKYIDAFLSLKVNSPQASLYMELCEYGSLDDLVDRYLVRRTVERGVRLPESFLWHTFHSLIKAIAYLHWGLSPRSRERPEPHSSPHIILHRDIKPANIFLRRADRGGIYPSVVLGDFGIAIQKGDPLWDADGACGTFAWQPPEVPLHDTLGRGDVWSVGAVVLSLCYLDIYPLPPPPRGVRNTDWDMDPAARAPELPLPRHYSSVLTYALDKAMTLRRRDRPTSHALFFRMKDWYTASTSRFEDMPSWAFK